MRLSRKGLSTCLIASLALVSCGGDDEPERVDLPSGCAEVAEPAPKEVDLPKPKGAELRPPSETTAVVTTSCGEFAFELDTRRSPKTTASFAYLVENGVYEGTAFHRIVPGFVIQGGDPQGDGRGGPGYFIDEPPAPDTEYTEGSVAMAKTPAEPPGRSGSQFFVVPVADAALPADYAPLGRVTEGIEVVKRIAELGDPASGESGTPTAPVIIESIELR